MSTCLDCTGSGSCDSCDGYGITAESHPGAADARPCPACPGDGVCPGCHGTGIACTANTLEESSCR